MKNPINILASCFGVGLSPVAPGTMGSLFAMLFFYFTIDLGQEVQVVISVILIMLGFWICGASAIALNDHDHSSIVWDEMSVMYAILLFQNIAIFDWILLFLLFRLFDIWKPWPINYIDEQVTGGLGIMLDDIAAGLATVATFQFFKILIFYEVYRCLHP